MGNFVNDKYVPDGNELALLKKELKVLQDYQSKALVYDLHSHLSPKYVKFFIKALKIRSCWKYDLITKDDYNFDNGLDRWDFFEELLPEYVRGCRWQAENAKQEVEGLIAKNVELKGHCSKNTIKIVKEFYPEILAKTIDEKKRRFELGKHYIGAFAKFACYTKDDFCKNMNISETEFREYLDNIEQNDSELFDKAKTVLGNSSKIGFQKVKVLLDATIKDIQEGKFNLFDYYLKTNVKIEELLTTAKALDGVKGKVLERYLYSNNRDLRPAAPQAYLRIYIGNKCISQIDINTTIDYMRKNKLPMIKGVFDRAMRRYVNGTLPQVIEREIIMDSMGDLFKQERDVAREISKKYEYLR